jgi:hypothetical protein
MKIEELVLKNENKRSSFIPIGNFCNVGSEYSSGDF